MSSNFTSDISLLDELAAQLIQLEPEDSLQIAHFCESIRKLIGQKGLPESVEAILEEAVKKLEERQGDNAPLSQEILATIGNLIEKAVEKYQKQMVKERINYFPSEFDADLIKEFVVESMELVANAEEALLTLENIPDDKEAIATVFRAFHTIKGASAFLKLNIISEFAHYAETFFSKLREGEIRYGGEYAEVALYSLDMLRAIILATEKGLTGQSWSKPEGFDELIEVLQHPEKVANFRKKKELASALTRMDDERKSSLRVRTDRLDKLIDMVGEMVIAYSMIIQETIKLGDNHYELQQKISEAGKIVRELQNLSLSIRMVPLKSIFQRMVRLGRDLANQSGKKIVFDISGERTEVDRNLVELITDPLMHMIRNSVDHGIEFPEERRKNGKPEEGIIKLFAYHSGSNVVIEIADDGRGLDRDLIFQCAQTRGLTTKGDSLNDQEILNLIFEPGFSTAQIVSEVSGRGVGLDVVKKNITALGGKIEVQSTLNKGCVFRIQFPLTLAIIDGMIIRVGKERYVVPTSSIVRALQPKREEINTILEKGEMLSLQGRFIPLVRLANLFNIDEAQNDPTQALVVVVEDNYRYIGIVADEILGQQQVVIKSLGEALPGIPSISGGAILADGQVGLILDISGLIKIAHADGMDYSTKYQKPN